MAADLVAVFFTAFLTAFLTVFLVAFFAAVLVGVAEAVGETITAALAIPTIGIGASVKCDGQILVTEDMLGLSGARVPKFVKRYANLEEIMRSSVQRYADEVRASQFPEPQHCFGVKRT